MGYIEVSGYTLHRGAAGANGPVIYVVDSPEHPFELGECASTLNAHVLSLPISSWNTSLTPWPAAGLYREEPAFGGDAQATLDELVHEAIPAVEKSTRLAPCARALCGYSLGGLFALYGLLHADVFRACACVSGSVWYEGWVEHVRAYEERMDGRFAYLSVGTKEKRAARPLLKGVQRNMEDCVGLLRERGCEVRYVTGPGTHFQHVEERLSIALHERDTSLA